MRIKTMADKYAKEHPELSKEDVMRHVVEKICGKEGVDLFNNLVGDKKKVKEVIKGQDFSSLEKLNKEIETEERAKENNEANDAINQEINEESAAENN